MRYNPKIILSGILLSLNLDYNPKERELILKPVFPKDFNPPRIESRQIGLTETNQKIIYNVADSLGYPKEKIPQLSPYEILDLSSKITDFCFEYSYLMVHKVKKEKLTLQEIVEYGESFEDSIINENFKNIKDTIFLNQYAKIETKKERINFIKKYKKELEKIYDHLTVDELITLGKGKRDNLDIVCRHYTNVTIDIANFLYNSVGYNAKAFETDTKTHAFVAVAYEDNNHLVVTFDCPTGKDIIKEYNPFKELTIPINELTQFKRDIIKKYKKKAN